MNWILIAIVINAYTTVPYAVNNFQSEEACVMAAEKLNQAIHKTHSVWYPKATHIWVCTPNIIK